MKTTKKIKAFVWKRVVLDRQGGSNNVAKNDLRGPDPNWIGKTVIWKDIKEEKFVTLEMIEDLFSDKTKIAPVKVVDTGKVDLNKPKTFFDSSKGQNLFIVLSRLPKADTLLIALDNLNEKTVSTDNLQSLLKNWPGEEFDDLIRENDENPETKWDKTEAYFVTLGKKKKFETRIKIWLFKMQFEKNVKAILDSLNIVINGFKEIRSEEKFMRILGAILKVGNCMNAGNKNRG